MKLMVGRNANSNQGSYVLLVELSRGEMIEIGRLGNLTFPRGFYAYVGSAMNGLRQRVNRHLKKDKKLHWHIDYLLEKASVCEVALLESEVRLECKISCELTKRLESFAGFGCSDCNCKSHLFYGHTLKQIKSGLGEATRRLSEHPETAEFSGVNPM